MFLNEYRLLQVSLNSVISIVQLGYLLKYMPYKDRSVLASCVTTEIFVTLTISLTGLFLLELSDSTRLRIEITIIAMIIAALCMQFLVIIKALVVSCKHALHWIRLKRSIHPSPNLDTDQIVYTKAVVIEKELGKIGSVELNEINDYERIN